MSDLIITCCECETSGDELKARKVFISQCGHFYCSDCIISLRRQYQNSFQCTICKKHLKSQTESFWEVYF